MKKSIILLAACAIALVGCKQEKEQGAAIKINANVQSSTKAVINGTQFPNDATDVFAVTATTSSTDISTVHFASAYVSMKGSQPEFSPSQFYPSNGGQNLFFFAYAPSKGGKYDGVAGTVTYTLNSSSVDNEKIDIMSAQDLTGCSKDNGKNPSFTFAHKLMMFKFTVQGNAKLSGKYIKSVQLLEQPIEAVLNIVNGNVTFTPELKGVMTAYNCGTGAGIQISENASAEFGCAMLAPSAAPFKVKVVFGGVDDSTPTSELIATGTLTDTAEALAGYSHLIAMTMNPVEITMTTTITDWKPGKGGSVTFE